MRRRDVPSIVVSIFIMMSYLRSPDLSEFAIFVCIGANGVASGISLAGCYGVVISSQLGAFFENLRNTSAFPMSFFPFLVERSHFAHTEVIARFGYLVMIFRVQTLDC